MSDIYYKVDKILPADETPGRVDIKVHFRQKGTSNKEAFFITSTFFTDNNKTIAQLIDDALKQARQFAEALAKTENFLNDE